MTLVVDASVVVAALLEGSRAGDECARALTGQVLAAPHLLPFEVADVLRRLERTGAAAPDAVAQARQDLDDLPVELWPWEAVALSAWGRRGSLSAYDASYVALAEQLSAPLLTLDARLARGAGSACEVRVLA